MRFPLYKPTLTKLDIAAVLRVLRSGWISHRGPVVAEFEKAFAQAVGARYAVAVSSGTAALHCALVGMARGGATTMPGLTYVATRNAAIHAGCEPKYVDVDPRTWVPKEPVAIGVPLYGYPAAGGTVTDAAEALGSRHRGPASAWSFFANKTLTTGEGGMVTTDYAAVAKVVREMSHQGEPEGTPGVDFDYYETVRLGWNYRMTALQAALGLSQLGRLNAIMVRKREIAAWYRRELAGQPVEFQSSHPSHTHWLVSARVQERDALMTYLTRAGVETRPVFPAMGDTPVAHRIAAQGLSFPSWPGLGLRGVLQVCGKVKEFYR